MFKAILAYLFPTTAIHQDLHDLRLKLGEYEAAISNKDFMMKQYEDLIDKLLTQNAIQSKALKHVTPMLVLGAEVMDAATIKVVAHEKQIKDIQEYVHRLVYLNSDQEKFDKFLKELNNQ